MRTIKPYPIFHAFTQTFADGIHQDVFRLLHQAMMVAQSVVKKIPLPFNGPFDGHKLFPVVNQRFHARFPRKRDDRVQMIRHEQTEPAMPDQPFVVVRHGGEDTVANASLTKLVFARWRTFDGNEKAASFWCPRRDSVRQFFADRQIHVLILINGIDD